MKNLKKAVATGFAALGLFGAAFMFNVSDAEATMAIDGPFKCFYDSAAGDCSGSKGTGCGTCD